MFDTASAGHIDVIYSSLNPGETIDPESIIDDNPEFSLDGPAVNLVVNGHATQLDSRTFRYSFTGSLVTGLTDNTVNVEFIAGTSATARTTANPMRWVNDTLPPPVRAR